MAKVYWPSITNWWAIAFLSFFPSLLAAQDHEQQAKQVQLDQKLAPAIHSALASKELKAYRVAVKDEVAFQTWLKQQGLTHKAQKNPNQKSIFTITDITGPQLLQLASTPFIAFVDQANRKAQEETELKDADFVMNNIPKVHSLFPHLTGNGLTVSVKEEAFNPHDLDLRGRVLSPEAIGSSHSLHATTMATIIAGAGNSGPKGKGIASEALLHHSNFSELFPDNSSQLIAKGILVQNHSYGVGVENYYGLEAVAYDQQTHQNPDLLHVFSSGNSGNKIATSGTYAGIAGFANLTGQFKTSKNTLSVGAIEADKTVGANSSRGPAYDGRIKPELVAYGKGGTSEAAAVVSGVAAILQQAHKQVNNGNPAPSSLIKAALINSADDVGRPAVDFETGFGNVDALGAIRTIKDKRYMKGQISQSQTLDFEIQVPTGSRQLKVTLAWNDPEAEPNTPMALINDLDLLVREKSSGKLWQPWVLSSFPHPDSLSLTARRGIDRLNNVEQVTVSLPASGTYELLVKGHSISGAQNFSLVFESEVGFEWLYPATGTVLNPKATNKLKWQGSLSTETANLEYKSLNSSQWQFIKQVNLQDQEALWQSPDTIAIVQLRLVNTNQELVSEPFLLAKQLRVQVGFNCPEQTMLAWPAMQNADTYQVYKMGQKYLEPLFITSDTMAILDKKNLPDLGEYLAVAPIIKGVKAPKSDALAYQSQSVGCYVKSFLPEQFVMDTVNLNLELGTNYNLASITLERIERGITKNISTISPISTQLTYKLKDESPLLGKNVYRVRLQTQNGQVYFSEPEEVLHARELFIQAYPNPVEAGQPFTVAVKDDTAVLYLYDQLGKLVYSSEETGVVKVLETATLKKGVYMLRVLTPQGFGTTRIVIL